MIIGRITRPHGVRGEVRVEILTDRPERFAWLTEVLVGKDNPVPVAVERVRLHKTVAILKLLHHDTRSQAEALRGQYLQVPIEEAIPLEEDEFFLYQLVGLQVQTEEGEALGELAEVLKTGANDVFIIHTPGGELLLPDIPDVILDIDLDTGRILVRIPAGLRDE